MRISRRSSSADVHHPRCTIRDSHCSQGCARHSICNRTIFHALLFETGSTRFPILLGVGQMRCSLNRLAVRWLEGACPSMLRRELAERAEWRFWSCLLEMASAVMRKSSISIKSRCRFLCFRLVVLWPSHAMIPSISPGPPYSLPSHYHGLVVGTSHSELWFRFTWNCYCRQTLLRLWRGLWRRYRQRCFLSRTLTSLVVDKSLFYSCGLFSTRNIAFVLLLVVLDRSTGRPFLVIHSRSQRVTSFVSLRISRRNCCHHRWSR